MSSRDELIRSVGWVALVVTAFVLSRPYDGIKHDGVLYLAQALSRLHPEIFRGDVFFRFGSQDQYTLFTPGYAWLISHFGLNRADLALVLGSQVAFLLASFALVRALVPAGLRGLAMLSLVCGIGVYGAGLVFRIAEPFVTPRPFVEAATLLAIALLVSGGRLASIAILAVGAALHPLVSIAGIMYWWIHLVLRDRRWAWLLAVGLVPVAAGLAGIAPFTQLYQRFDDDWLRVLLENNYNLFTTRWSLQDWTFLAFDFVSLSLCMHYAEGKLRNAIKAAFAVAVLGLALAFVGADLLQNVLLTDIQAWRVLWLLHWLAVATVPITLLRLWKDGPPSQLVAGLMAYAFITRGLPTSLAALLMAAASFHFRSRLAVRQTIVDAVTAALLAGAFMNWFNNAGHAHDSASFDSINPVSDYIIQALSKPFVVLVLGIGISWFGLRGRNPAPAATLAVALVLVAGTVWDQRTPYRAYLESAQIGAHPFSRFVGPGEEVLWHGDLVAPWVMMLRRSYFSIAQQSGQMFNRDTAIDLQRRGTVLALLDLQETVCAVMNKLNRRYDSCEPDLQVVQELCREAPDLGHIVLTTRIEGKWVDAWTPPVEMGGRIPYYYLYDCATLVRD